MFTPFDRETLPCTWRDLPRVHDLQGRVAPLDALAAARLTRQLAAAAASPLHPADQRRLLSLHDRVLCAWLLTQDARCLAAVETTPADPAAFFQLEQHYANTSASHLFRVALHCDLPVNPADLHALGHHLPEQIPALPWQGWHDLCGEREYRLDPRGSQRLLITFHGAPVSTLHWRDAELYGYTTLPRASGQAVSTHLDPDWRTLLRHLDLHPTDFYAGLENP